MKKMIIIGIYIFIINSWILAETLTANEITNDSFKIGYNKK
jgi:hypothetical protein